MFKHCGCTRRCEAAHPGQPIPTDKRVIPSHMAWCPVVKTQGEKEEAGTFELQNLSSQVTIPHFPGNG